MGSDTDGYTADVVTFVQVRPPLRPDPATERVHYIRDDVRRRSEVAVGTEGDDSTVMRDYLAIIENPTLSDDAVDRTVLERLLSLSLVEQIRPVWREDEAGFEAPNLTKVPWVALEGRRLVRHGGRTYLLPEVLRPVGDDPVGAAVPWLVGVLTEVLGSPDEPPAPGRVVDLDALATRVAARIGSPLREVLYEGGQPASGFVTARRQLFDQLYLLALFTRLRTDSGWVRPELGPTMDGLRALHVLVALADVEALTLPPPPNPGPLVGPGGPTRPAQLTRAPVTQADVLGRWGAMPVIPIVLARGRAAATPFTDVSSVGTGDLLVVRQRLIGYRAGEISDIENVMAGEDRRLDNSRTHRREDRYSLLDLTDSMSGSEASDTGRFAIKREAERVVKADSNWTGGGSFTYAKAPITITANVGHTATNSSSTTGKEAVDWSKEVVRKAVTNVTRKVSTERSTTILTETVDRARHRVTNTAEEARHRSAIFQWVDKEYEGQVYNYGRRAMYEFVVPEPAAFLVEQRLQAFESTLTLPRRPSRPDRPLANLGFEPGAVNEARFRRLAALYDLDGLEPPAPIRYLPLVDSRKGGTWFSGTLVNNDNRWDAVSFEQELDASGYEVHRIKVTGHVFFRDTSPNPQGPPAWVDNNVFQILIDGHEVASFNATQEFGNIDSSSDRLTFLSGDGDLIVGGTGIRRLNAHVLGDGPTRVLLAFQDGTYYELSLTLVARPSAELTSRWQHAVHAQVTRQEQERLDAAHRAAVQAYEAEMREYHTALDELRGLPVNDILRGQSPAANEEVMRNELKRLCLAMMTRDFDSDRSDDRLTRNDTTVTDTVEAWDWRLQVTGLDDDEEPSARFEIVEDEMHYTAPDRRAAAEKARYIAFLEQAFEWDKLGWICYPYFWAAQDTWAQLAARDDPADPVFGAFLRAGAARVLLAVTPEFEQAVSHFLATGQPWNGGPLPVLGDPLYLPLHDEIRRAQDIPEGGVPVGDPWRFTVPTALRYLHGSADVLPQPAGVSTPGGPTPPP